VKPILLIVCLAFLVGCAQTTEIFKGDEKIYTVKSKSDAVVSYKNGSEEVVVNNQGRPSFMETVFGTIFMQTDVNVGDD